MNKDLTKSVVRREVVIGALWVKSPVLENIHVHVLYFMLTPSPPVRLLSALMVAYFLKIAYIANSMVPEQSGQGSYCLIS